MMRVPRPRIDLGAAKAPMPVVEVMLLEHVGFGVPVATVAMWYCTCRIGMISIRCR